MGLHFSKIRWKNFLSTGNDWIEVELDRHDTNLIIGSNGGGKTTICDALAFSLYGKPYRNINKPQLINSITGKGCLTECEFTIKNTNYLVRRGIKPSIFEVYVNGELLSQDSSIKDYQEYFEKKILQINYRSFIQIVVLGSTNYVPFMQLRAHERRAVIEDILDIEIFTRMHNALKEKVHTNKNNITTTKYKIDLLNEKIILTKKHINEMNSFHLSDRKMKEDQIDSRKKENKDLEETLELECHKLSSIEDKLKEIEKIEANVAKRISLYDKIKNKLDALNLEMNSILLTDNCPTCEQKLNDDFKDKQINKRIEKKNEYVDSLDKLEEIIQKIKLNLEDKDSLLAEKENVTKIMFDFKNAISYNNKRIGELEKVLSLVPKETDSNIQDLESELTEENEKYVLLLEEKQRYEIASSLLKDGGIKTQIIKQYVPIINKLMNMYLASMDFFVQFELDENFNEKIKSRFRDDFTFDSFSEGEKSRLNLCLLLTWRAVAKLRNSTSMNLLILDEVFDGSLDRDGITYLTQIINTSLKDANVFVISHKTDEMLDKFSNVIFFEKIKNFSKIKNLNT